MGKRIDLDYFTFKGKSQMKIEKRLIRSMVLKEIGSVNVDFNRMRKRIIRLERAIRRCGIEL